MERKKEIFLVALFIALALILRLVFMNPLYYGADFFYHATIVEQSLENGRLQTSNDLALCYEGTENGHPAGFYLLPYIFAKIFGLDIAFIILPFLLGLISLAIFYFLIKLLFNQKAALWALFFASISIAFVSKSHPNVYRGENLVYPFLLLSLYFAAHLLCENDKKKQYIFSMLAGGFSGLTAVLWGGSPLVLVVYASCCVFVALYNLFMRRPSRHVISLLSLSLIAQALLAYGLFFLLDTSGKIHIFLEEYYFLVIGGVLLLFLSIFLKEKLKSWVPFFVYILLVITAMIILWGKIIPLLEGFGSVGAAGGYSFSEVASIDLFQIYSFFFLSLIIMALGLYTLFRNFSVQASFFFGWLVPVVYLMFFGVRYVYFASLPLFVLIGLFVSNKKTIGKKFNIGLFTGMVLGAVMLGYIFYIYPIYFAPTVEQRQVDVYNYIKDNLEDDACILQPHKYGAIVEYFSKKYYYFHSLGINEDRWKRGYGFLLQDGKVDLGVDGSLYALLIDDDLNNLIEIMYGGKVSHSGSFAYLEQFNDSLYTGNYLGISINLTDEGQILALSDYNAFDVVVNKMEDGTFDVYRIVDDNSYYLRGVFIDGKYYSGDGIGCVYIGNFSEYIEGVYFDDPLCNSRMYKMLTGQKIEGMEKIYFKDGVSLYKILDPGGG